MLELSKGWRKFRNIILPRLLGEVVYAFILAQCMACNNSEDVTKMLKFIKQTPRRLQTCWNNNNSEQTVNLNNSQKDKFGGRSNQKWNPCWLNGIIMKRKTAQIISGQKISTRNTSRRLWRNKKVKFHKIHSLLFSMHHKCEDKFVIKTKGLKSPHERMQQTMPNRGNKKVRWQWSGESPINRSSVWDPHPFASFATHANLTSSYRRQCIQCPPLTKSSPWRWISMGHRNGS